MNWLALRLMMGQGASLFTQLLGFVVRNIWPVACALLALLAWHEHAGKISAEQTLQARIQQEAVSHVVQVVTNHEPQRKSVEIARQSNAKAPAYYRSVAAAGRAHRVSAPSCVSAPGVRGADSAPSVNDRSIEASGLVSRPKQDDDLLLAAAGRAAQMQADAQSLIDSGVAVAEEPDSPSEKAPDAAADPPTP